MKENEIISEEHAELVKKVMENMPDEEALYDLSDTFRIFGDSTRIKILYSMFDTELNVGEISKILNLSQSTVSHQLRILKDAKLVKFRRAGKSMYYSLDDDHVRMILSLGMEHLDELTEK
ncbi:transcriptional regulator, ArsR family [Eubacterium ruminantium]|nr:transcriptional regulator, ArsR family [Eubacterium ruminantium]